MEREMPKAGEVWRHFKGNCYLIIAAARHTETGEMHTAEPMHSFAKKLDKEIFAEVYHCIYVNVDYVCRVDADSLLLDNGVVIPVSRRKRKEVMTAVMKRLVTR